MNLPAPRVRFAPSPTGYLHVGGARSALFNWLFARRTGGTFILRIEDTDAERSKPELIELIMRTMDWLGLDFDEGPYRQSERTELYRTAAERLLVEGHAYLVDRDDNRVEGTQLVEGLAVRFRMPSEGFTEFDDLIRGRVAFEHANLEDFVVWRANGTPTFLLANAVDDLDMRISHAIRGEDLLSSAPKVLLIARALGAEEVPVYAHLPLLVNAQRQKLSKRRDDVAVEDYRDRGYLAEAVRNYLALLGWGPADGVEIRPIEEIVALFRLEDVNKAPAFFDTKKLDHINSEYVRALPIEDFLTLVQPFLHRDPPWLPEDFDSETMATIAPLVQSRVRTLAEVGPMVAFLFVDTPEIDPDSWRKAVEKEPAAAALLDGTLSAFETCSWDSATLHESLLKVGEGLGLKLAKAQAPIRVAVTGRTVGPPLFESLELLGRDRTLERLRMARARV